MTKTRQALLKASTAQTLWLEAQVYRALAHPTRLNILYILAEEPRTVGDLADALKQPASGISRHLSVLHETMLVRAHRLGANMVYALSDRRIIQVAELLGLASVHLTRSLSIKSRSYSGH